MKFTPEQVIEMAREAGLPDAVGAHPAFKQALNIAADRALEAAAHAADTIGVDGIPIHGDDVVADWLRAMKEHQ